VGVVVFAGGNFEFVFCSLGYSEKFIFPTLCCFVPPAGIEPALSAPQADVLSIKLQRQTFILLSTMVCCTDSII
jgi:hypothetical protein